jgi:hypothetical protein
MLDQPALRIVIDRTACGAVVSAVEPPPPLPVARLFLGQSPQTAARRAAMVFNVCGAAQEAAVRAALGLAPDPGAPRRVLMETLRDHALKLAVGWPKAVGLDPDPVALAAVARLGADGGAALRAALIGPEGLPADLAGFETWLAAGRTAPARVLARVWHGWDAGWGRVDLPLWTTGDSPPDFARAEWRGGPFECGLPAVHAAHPLLAALAARQGRGLVWRLAARLADAALALDALAADAPPPAAASPEPGFGVARAARGAMLVRAAAEDGRVTRLDRLSPTDAALHPDGLLARMLDTLPSAPDAPLAAVVALAVEAADPCLACTLTLADTATAAETDDVHSLRLLG